MTWSLLTNLVAYYKMETLTTDSVGSFSLTNNNSVASATWKIWNCADLWTANTNKSLSTTSLPFVATWAFSVSLWAKMNTEISSGSQTFFCLADYWTNWQQNRIEYDFNWWSRRMRFIMNAATLRDINSTTTLWTTNWNHFIITYSWWTWWTLTFYINGTSVWTNTWALSGSLGWTDIMTIWSLENLSQYASSLIDEVWIWTKQLTSWEVTTLYNSWNWITY